MEPGAPISREELHLASRNHALPLEALGYDLTPAGLHYLLIHYDIPVVEVRTWRLEVDGVVARPLRLTLDDLRRRPRVDVEATLECAGNGRALLEPRPVSQPWFVGAVGNALWGGTPLSGVLDEAGVGEGALEVVFSGLDHGLEGGVEQDYERSLPLGEAMRADVLLVYEMNDQPLLPQHGFPLRLIVPGWYGMTHVKWLRSVTVVDRPFEGYQHARAYRMRADESQVGTSVTRILPRSLLIPPGFPEFFRARIADRGSHLLRGRAWSGLGTIERVEVSQDGGGTWSDAHLDGLRSSPYAWRGWSFEWDARPGEHVLCSRATDATGATQPLEPVWNVGGYQNNAVQRVPVTVR